MTISEAFNSYRVDVICFTNQSRSTEEMSNFVGKSLIKLVGDIDVSELTFDMVRDWKEQLSKDRSQNTVRGYVIKLRCVLGYLQKRKIECIDPDLVPCPKIKQTIPAYITKEEVACLIESAGKANIRINRIRDKAIISLLYASGIRVSELCNLDIAQIDNKQFTVVGKGGKIRLCFMDDRTRIYLTEYLKMRREGYDIYIIARGKCTERIRSTHAPDNNPALFTSTITKKRITKSDVERMVTLATKRCGLERKVTPHVFRHTFATELLKTNTNLRYIQEFLGHSSPQTTMMYTHISNPDLEKVYKEHHLI